VNSPKSNYKILHSPGPYSLTYMCRPAGALTLKMCVDKAAGGAFLHGT
jgi:hypothetical protein